MAIDESTVYKLDYTGAQANAVVGFPFATQSLTSTQKAQARTNIGAADESAVQAKITASGLLKGDGAGGITANGTISVAQGGTGNTTLTSNAVLCGNGTSAIKKVATASGAAYATSANGALTFGTLPVAQGGTGETTLQALRNSMGLGNTTGVLPVANGGTGLDTLTSGYALIGAGTSAVTLRNITNITAVGTTLTANTNLITANTLRYIANRTNGAGAANTSYTTYMFRGQTLNAADTNPTLNGTIAWTYA